MQIKLNDLTPKQFKAFQRYITKIINPVTKEEHIVSPSMLDCSICEKLSECDRLFKSNINTWHCLKRKNCNNCIYHINYKCAIGSMSCLNSLQRPLKETNHTRQQTEFDITDDFVEEFDKPLHFTMDDKLKGMEDAE